MKRIVHLILTLGTVGLLALAILLALTASVQPLAHADDNIIKVPDDYPTIQAAIDAATDGDTILVAGAGSDFYEERLSITKGITLSGGWYEDFTVQVPGMSIIDGQGLGRVISITCALSDTVVTIDGFTIMNGDASGLGTPAMAQLPVSETGLYWSFDGAQDRSETLPVTEAPDLLSPSEQASELRPRLADLAARGLYPGGPAAYEAMLARLERLTARAEGARARASSSLAPSRAQPQQGAGTGGGIYSENASLQLLNCSVVGNVASQDGAGAGGGVFVAQAPPAGVRIVSNYVGENVGCTHGEGWGGGLYVFDAPGAIIGLNVVEGNVASNDGDGYGGGLYVYRSPGAVIQDNLFLENLGSDAGYGSEGMGGGLGVDSSPDAVVRNNQVERNIASAAWHAGRGLGGGLYLHAVDGVVVRDNLLRDNVAVLRSNGGGGGLFLATTHNALVTDNEVTGNWGSMFQVLRGAAGAGGIGVANVYSTTVSGNEIEENTACVYGAFEGSAVGGGVAGSDLHDNTQMIGNVITGNVACHTGCQWGGYGGGVDIVGAQDTVVADNTIADNVATLLDQIGLGGGLHLRDTIESQVLRNRLLRNRAGMADGSHGGGLVMDRLEGWSALATVDANLILDNQGWGCEIALMYGGFSFTNNVVAGNQASNGGGMSLYTIPQGGTVVNNTIANNGDIGVLVEHLDTPAFTLTNNIIVSHTVGISVSAEATVTVRYTLWNGNDTDITGTGTFTHTNPVTGSPAFVNPAAGDYHIGIGSAARDAGDPAGVPPAPDHDADGVSRPQGPAVDLGAYEWRGHWWYLPLVLKSWRADIGWAVGDPVSGYGTILHTTDGGRTWTRQGTAAEIPNTQLKEVSAVDDQNAWVVGANAILRTRNGGQTWEQQTLPSGLPTGFELQGIKALDANTVYVVGTPSILLQTTNGATWSQMSRGTDVLGNIAFQVVDAVDTGHVWTVGATMIGGNRTDPVIAFYNGLEWHLQPTSVLTSPTTAVIGISAIDPLHAWAVGGWGMPLATTADGGATWQVTAHPLSAGDMNRVAAVSPTTGWVAGDYGNVRYTTNAGATWYDVSVPSAFLFGITAMDDKTAWVVGPGLHGTPPGIIARTCDAQHWEVQSDPSWPNMNGISFVGARR